MEKAQAKGEVNEDVLRALEMDVTGKIMLASWRGARLEVIQVLREVRFHGSARRMISISEIDVMLNRWWIMY